MRFRVSDSWPAALGQDDVDLDAVFDRERLAAALAALARPVCALCGHRMEVQTCGYATVGALYLCHADDHDCYHRWTVYRDRPTGEQP